ncbi:hypothetical protein JCM8547_001426 [Rhodosporidiobolus lusitaniae]
MGRSPPTSKSEAQVKREREVKLIKRALAVTSIYMLAELVIGYQFSVLSLVADSYHMMNDVAAFVVQLYADKLGGLERAHDKETTAFSFGFSRVEFLANLIQGTLLLALCLTLALESLQRFYSTETITLPPIVVGMGAAALVWNAVMFRLFEDAHHHHDEDDAEGEERALGHPVRYRLRVGQAAVESPYRLARSAATSSVERSLGIPSFRETKSTVPSSHKASLKGFFNPQNSLAIHAMGDAMGNIAVIVDGLASWFFGPQHGKISGLVKSWSGIGYIDPLCSFVVVYVILIHAFPLVTKSSFALMHAFDPKKTAGVKKAFRGKEWLPRELRNDVNVELHGVSTFLCSLQ